REPGQMGHISPKIVRQVMQYCACRRSRRLAVLQPKSIQRSHLKMLAHGEDCRLRRKDPIVVRIQNPAEGSRGVPSVECRVSEDPFDLRASSLGSGEDGR